MASSSGKSTPSSKDGKDKKSKKTRPKSKEVEGVIEVAAPVELEDGPISRLSELELSYILRFLDHFQMFRSMRVSRNWSAAVRSVSLESLVLRTFYGCLEDEHVNSLVTRFPQLHTVCIHACPRLTEKSVKHLAKLSGLTSLDLSNCRNLSDGALIKLPVANVQKLTSIKVAHCGFSDRGLKLGVLPRLTSLDLSGCDSISDRLAPHLVQYSPNLLSLHAAGCPTLTNDFLTGIAKHTTLTDLNVKACQGLDHNGFLSFCDATANPIILKGLRKIDFSTTLINNSALTRLAEACLELEELALAFCHRIDDDGTQNLEKLQKLKYLNMSYTGISIGTLDRIEQINTIETLVFAGCKALKKVINNFIKKHAQIHVVYKTRTVPLPTAQS